MAEILITIGVVGHIHVHTRCFDVMFRRWVVDDVLAAQQCVKRPERATGFELPIVQCRKELRQITWSVSPSRRAI
jgi:hypothetical protein